MNSKSKKYKHVKKNSYFQYPEVLPVMVTRQDNCVFYQLSNSLSEKQYIAFVESELPGVIIGDYKEDEDQYHRSVLFDDKGYRLFTGSFEEDRARIWVEETKIFKSIYALYIKLFEYRKEIHDGDTVALGIDNPDKLFWDYFKGEGSKELNRTKEIDDNGYYITRVEFENSSERFSVIYPQLDYDPNEKFFNDSHKTIDGYYFNWSSFFAAIIAGDLSKYDGFESLDDSFPDVNSEMVTTSLTAIEVARAFPALRKEEKLLLDQLQTGIQQLPKIPSQGISITFKFENTTWSVILDEDFFEVSDLHWEDGDRWSSTRYKYYPDIQEDEIEGDLENWLEELERYSSKKDFSVSVFGDK